MAGYQLTACRFQVEIESIDAVEQVTDLSFQREKKNIKIGRATLDPLTP